MKKQLITICLLLWGTMIARAQTDYIQYEVSYYTAKMGQNDLFEKALAAHNKKFHNADPYKVVVYDVKTGPNSGDYILIMGPVTFTQIGGRPNSAEHNADWEKNVIPYVQTEGDGYFWRVEKDAGYNPTGSNTFGKSRLRAFTLNPGQTDRFKDMVKKIGEVYKAKNYPATYNVYSKYGASTGPHFIAEVGFADWSYLDRPNTFAKDFDEVHGDGSWLRWMDEFEIAVDRTKTYDELAEYMPALSSD